jgi:hypothetical protein
MKIFIAFLFIFFVLSCKAQDTLVYYPKDYVDTNFYPKEYCDSIVNFYQEMLNLKDSILQNPSIYGDTKITIHDSLGVKTLLKKQGQDSWYEIIDDSNRYKFWIIDDNLQIWIGDSLNARLFLQYQLK